MKHKKFKRIDSPNVGLCFGCVIYRDNLFVDNGSCANVHHSTCRDDGKSYVFVYDDIELNKNTKVV